MQILDGSYDMGVGMMPINAGRYQEVDFTDVVYRLDFRYTTGHPKPLPPYKNVLLPYSANCWLAILMSTVVVASLLVAIKSVDVVSKNITAAA